MSDQDPVAVMAEEHVCFSIYPEGARVGCCIGFHTLRSRFGALADGDMCNAVVNNMHLLEDAATRAWRSTPLGETVVVKAVDF